jgi:hypothetical protein
MIQSTAPHNALGTVQHGAECATVHAWYIWTIWQCLAFFFFFFLEIYLGRYTRQSVAVFCIKKAAQMCIADIAC